MIVYSFLFFTLLIATTAIWLLVNTRHWSRLLLACLLSVFIHLYGGWVYLSFYLKYLFDALVILALLYGLFKKKRDILAAFPVWRSIINVFLALAFGTLSVLFFTGTKPAPPVASLHFPFKVGNYLVLQGGKGLPSNVFHGSSSHSIYAMDIVKLNAYGQRCNHIFSKNLHDYYIFADTIYSPCDGVVQRAVDDNPDNIPPDRKRGPHNLNGVVIENSKYTVFLGHMKQHCVFVKVGDVLKTGMPIGLVGNSGFTIEPHLHIQVHAKSEGGLHWYQQPPMFVSFDGHEYLLFEKIMATNN